MKKANKNFKTTGNAKITESTIMPELFWQKNGRNYKLIDLMGRPARALPVVDIPLNVLKDLTTSCSPDGRVWAPGKLDTEIIKAPILGADEYYEGLAFTQDTVYSARAYAEQIKKRFAKHEKQEAKKEFNAKFAQLFGELSLDGVSIFWEPSMHKGFEAWQELLEEERYYVLMNIDTSMKYEDTGYWGLILRKEELDKAKESEDKILRLRVPADAITKVRDKWFIGGFKHQNGLNFVQVKSA